MNTNSKIIILCGTVFFSVLSVIVYSIDDMPIDSEMIIVPKTTSNTISVPVQNEIILDSKPDDIPKTTSTIQKIDKSGFKKAPSLVGISGYINTTPEELEKEMDDKVILYDIWTYSCINCKRTLPYVTSWNDKYSDQGLLIIGIHSPEFEFEKDIDNVQRAVTQHGITYPVIQDNDFETWKAFENRYWPRKYIADHEGFIRYDHIGEGRYAETEKVIQELLLERTQHLEMNSNS